MNHIRTSLVCTFSLLVFSNILAGTWNFSLYGTSFVYPTTWTVQSSSNSSVTLNIGTNRSLMIEFLPDNSPNSYVNGKIHLLDSLFLNLSFSWGPFTAANHWGYWVSTSQAYRTTFETFYGCFYYVRIPKSSSVLSISYVDYEAGAASWSSDIGKLTTLISTLTIQNDNVPNRYNFKNVIKNVIGNAQVKFPDNLTVTRLGTNALLIADNYDKLWDGIFCVQADTSFKGTSIDSAFLSAKRTAMVDTAAYGRDSLRILTDTVYADTSAELLMYSGKGRAIPHLRYEYYEIRGRTFGSTFFYDSKLTLSYSTYLDTILSFCVDFFRYPSSSVIPRPSFRQYDPRVPVARNDEAMIFNTLGRRIDIGTRQPFLRDKGSPLMWVYDRNLPVYQHGILVP